MIWFAFALLLTTLSLGALLQLDKNNFDSPGRRVFMNEIYPYGVKRILLSGKPPMMFGNPSRATWGLIQKIEAFPVEHQLVFIDELQGVMGRFFPKLLLQNFHSHYLYLSRYIDVRVLQLLIRIASNRRRADERNAHTACDVIRLVQQKYPLVRFEYLMPQYIMDWYNILGREFTMHSVCDREALTNEVHLSQSEEPLLVFLDRKYWSEHFLEPRRKRYAKAGYDIKL